MAYSLTNATSLDALINVIASFAGANGWTIDRNNLAGSNRTVTLHKGGDYVHLWNSDTSNLRVRGSVGYDGAQTPDAQPNVAASRAVANVGAGPYPNVYLFENNNCVFAVIEVSSGIYRHVAFGSLTKIGSYTGGTFFEATYYDTGTTVANSHPNGVHHYLFDNNSTVGNRGGVRCDVDGNSNYFAPFSVGSSYTTPVASGGMFADYATGRDAGERVNDGFYARSINSWSGITPIQPIKIRVERPSGYWSDIGEVPAIRFLNMARFQAGDEFTIGSDTWKVFPWARQGNVANQLYTYNLAFCYLKTP